MPNGNCGNSTPTPPLANAAAVALAAASASSLKKTPSFTVLDPTSGIPSDYTPRMQASLTSRHSFGVPSAAAAAVAAAAAAARFNAAGVQGGTSAAASEEIIRCGCLGLAK